MLFLYYDYQSKQSVQPLFDITSVITYSFSCFSLVDMLLLGSHGLWGFLVFRALLFKSLSFKGVISSCCITMEYGPLSFHT